MRDLTDPPPATDATSRMALWTALVLLLPLAGCLAGDDAPDTPPPAEWTDQRATPEGRTASEVSLAVDPTDPDHVLAAANSEGGLGVYRSHDGGATWQAEHLVPEDLFGPSGARFLNLGDPAVAFAPDGTGHIAGLALLPGSAVFVADDRDGWQGRIVWESEVAATFNDKEWLGVHPETGTLVVAWQREPALDQLRSVEAATGLDVDVGTIVVSRSTDGGDSWSLPEEVSRGLHSNGTQVAFTPDGTVHMLWVNYEEAGLDWVRSDDDGATWSEPRQVADVDIVGSYDRFERMHTLPALVASPVGEHLFAVWHDDRDGDADVRVAASLDGGASWHPTRMPEDEAGSGVIQFYPWAAVDGAGVLHVTYYSSVHDPLHPRFAYRHMAYDPGAQSWSAARDVSGTTFTAFEAPGGEDGQARSLGDYTGAAAGGGRVFAAWADGRAEASAIHVGVLEDAAAVWRS